MAAPVVARRLSFSFRDAKGETARLTVIIGGATAAAVDANMLTLGTHLQAISNAHVASSNDPSPADKRTYGTAANYQDVEDKAQLVFTDSDGDLHRYQIPAPGTSTFLADQETVNAADTGTAQVLTDFGTFVYGEATDTAPLTFIGGTRVRRRMHRKLNIFIKAPSLSGPAE